MAEIGLRELGAELQVVKEILLRIQENLAEEELEISDEVLCEVESARKSKDILHEDVLNEFL